MTRFKLDTVMLSFDGIKFTGKYRDGRLRHALLFVVKALAFRTKLNRHLRSQLRAIAAHQQIYGCVTVPLLGGCARLERLER
eukprot:scaffold17705_cov188-Skeletonema_dohrnii-CCMP3373.AAC.1